MKLTPAHKEITITVEGAQGVGKTRFTDILKELLDEGKFKELGDVQVKFKEIQT